jgi:signal transduction histidine kinase
MENEMKIEAVFWAGTAIMLFLAVALISLALYYQNNIYKLKHQEAERLLQASLVSERMERKRIAADLHDGLLGDLTALRVYAALLSKHNNAFTKNEEFIHFKAGIENAIESTRLISYKLMPPLLESHGLVVALQDYLNRISNNTNTSFEVVCEHKICLSPTNEYELFRVLQELSTNMIKHGKAKNCVITFTASPDCATVEIADDGMPYSFNEQSRSSKGNGMKNIISRLASINGALSQKQAEVGNCLLIKINTLC